MSSKKSPPRRQRTTLTPRTATKTSLSEAQSPQKAPETNEKARRPEPGAIIDYEYLWKREDDAGQKNGSKVRPCYILAVQKVEELYIVVVLPISTSATGARVPIHPRERAALGLPENSDLVIEEANAFQWPGPDIRPQKDRQMMRKNPASKKLTDAIATARKGRTLEIVYRTR